MTNKLLILSILALAACAQASSSSKRDAVPGTQPGARATALIRSDYEPGEITKLCKKAIVDVKAKVDAIVKAPAEGLLAFEEATGDFSDTYLPLTFMGSVSTNPKLRDEGKQCEEDVNTASVELMTRKDLYDAIKVHVPRNKAEKRLLGEWLKQFEDNGLKLSAEKLAEFKKLKTELAQLEARFSKNYDADTTQVLATADELNGVPSEFLEGLKKDGEKYILTVKDPHYVMVMQNAKSGEMRRKMLLARETRSSMNSELLKSAVKLRHDLAKLAGFETWADFKTRTRMAKTAKTAVDFEEDLRVRLAPRLKSDLAKLLAFKKQLEPTATELKAWDINYLSYQLQKRDYSLDNEVIKQYFPADTVVQSMFDIYSKLLGVRYEQVQDAITWAPEVKLYKILPAGGGRREIIGYFYTDFFPREGKYSHAAAFTLFNERARADGSRALPISSIVANFNPPTANKPSLLMHSEVETLFHEFGHIMHQTLTRGRYASLAGTSVAQDFVEAPSQMLENWVWDPAILNNVSGHYQDHKKKLPADLLKKMIAARDFNQGYVYTRQLLFGTFDLRLHTDADGVVDPDALYVDVFKQLIGFDPVEGTKFPASFGHLMGGYDAAYYGYLWSKVYAEDMFTQFSPDRLLDPSVGAKYRRWILERGNELDAMDLLKGFLGRKPNNKAFLKKLGLKTSS